VPSSALLPQAHILQMLYNYHGYLHPSPFRECSPWQHWFCYFIHFYIHMGKNTLYGIITMKSLHVITVC
jgi:hypothetical protein